MRLAGLMRLAGVLFLLLWLPVGASAAGELTLDGTMTQGGLIQGRVAPGTEVWLDERALQVSPEGVFIFGFHRDAPGSATLRVRFPDGEIERRALSIAAREYDIQRIDGLDQKKVTPPPEVLARIREEGARVKASRSQVRAETDYAAGFVWPAEGRISGVYGSQRILNGAPRRPHYGVDVAAPVGTVVRAPAAGLVVLAEADLYYSGGTLILDHGHGLSSSFLHLSRIDVVVGQFVAQGDAIAAIGATGRVTGAHLDWRMNWFDARIDPALLVGPMPAR